MVPAARWLVVAVTATAIAAAPTLVRAVPPHGSHISAAALAARMRAAQDVGWSGEAHTRGTLAVPVTGSTFSGFARLLGGESDLRVWWRGPTTWRVDRLRATGETDLVRDGGLTVHWSYESQKVTFTPYSDIRLPDDSDVIPVTLAHRMLSGAHADELRRLPSRRIVGRSAAGLRLVPSDPRSTIGHVDMWGDDTTGLPLRVEVYAEKASQPMLTTQLTDLDVAMPKPREADVELAPGVDLSHSQALDAVAGANVFAPFVPPRTLVGLKRFGTVFDHGAVGIYGRGPTAVLAVPLRDYVAGALRRQLRTSPQARESGATVALEMGPLSVLLADVAGGQFLLLGTVDPDTLVLAAHRLQTSVVRTNR